MKYLTEDKDGKKCAAKTLFTISLIVCLVKILLSGITFGDFSQNDVDFTGLGLFISPLAGVYWGRSYTKSIKNV